MIDGCDSSQLIMTLIAGVVGSVGFVYSCFVLWKKRILLAKPADILKGKAKITPPQKLLMLLPASGLCIGVGLFLRGVPDKGVAMQILSPFLAMGLGVPGFTYVVFLYMLFWLQVLELKKSKAKRTNMTGTGATGTHNTHDVQTHSAEGVTGSGPLMGSMTSSGGIGGLITPRDVPATPRILTAEQVSDGRKPKARLLPPDPATHIHTRACTPTHAHTHAHTHTHTHAYTRTAAPITTTATLRAQTGESTSQRARSQYTQHLAPPATQLAEKAEKEKKMAAKMMMLAKLRKKIEW